MFCGHHFVYSAHPYSGLLGHGRFSGRKFWPAAHCRMYGHGHYFGMGDITGEYGIRFGSCHE